MQQPQFQLPPLSSTQEITCQAETSEGVKCGSQFFISMHIVRKISKLLVPGSPQDIILPIPVLICSECGEVLQESLPPELQEKPNGKDNLRILN